MDKGLWQETVRRNVHKEDLGSCNRYEGEICTKKEESVLVIKRKKRGGVRIYQETIEEGIH